jgi:hypothetical protein
VRLAEHGCEGQHENLVTSLIDDMQDPIALSISVVVIELD